MQKPVNVFAGLPPASSFWCDCRTRDELAAAVAARRHQQGIPTSAEVTYDPMLAATAELKSRLAVEKARRDLRGRVRR